MTFVLIITVNGSEKSVTISAKNLKRKRWRDMIIKELYVFGDMYEDVETEDNIEECIKHGEVLHIKFNGNSININSAYIVSYIL